jgi:M6 family metalloprotease-like protein
VSAIFGETLTFPQPAGPQVRLRVFGDEFYARYETLDGHTVVLDTDLGLYCYATVAGGRLVSTGVAIDKPPPPGLPTHLREAPEVRNARFGRRYDELRPRLESEASHRVRTIGVNDGLLEGRRVSEGIVHGLTILANFADLQATVAAADVDALLNEEGYSRNGNRGSVRDYYLTMSNGRLDYRNTVVGPVQLSKPLEHYKTTLLLREALDLALSAEGVDLAHFDSRGEGIVDAINVMYAGRTVYEGELWPHNSVRALSYPGGIRTHFYQVSSMGRSPVDLSIGTFAHETGHLLCRFPDLYDYGKEDGDFEKSAGVGVYCLMGSGNHLGQGRAPAAISAYLRDLVGWPDEVVPLDPGEHAIQQGDYRRVHRFSPLGRLNEYFIVENRSRVGTDASLPSSGLAVFHCDTLGSNEWEDGTRERHYQLALLQADGHLDLENNRNTGDGGDLFGGASGVILSHDTLPASRLWDSTGSGLVISDVGAPGSVVRFRAGAAPPAGGTVRGEAAPDLLIPDDDPVGAVSSITLEAAGTVKAVRVSAEIVHPWIGDLRIELVAPSGARVVLRDQAGGGGDDLSETWDSAAPGSPLAALRGEPAGGAWTLHVTDAERRDTGRLNRWSIEVDPDPVAAPVERRADPALPIPDAPAGAVHSAIVVPERGVVRLVAVSVDIAHTYVGDLRVELLAPSGAAAILHDRQGGGRRDLVRTWDGTTAAGLAAMAGLPVTGEWRLAVRDLAPRDTGMLRSWSLRIELE